MNTIQSLVESANPWKSLQGDAARLANKWNKTGLLEGLGEDVNKNNMALMLENQAKQLVVESSQTGTQSSFSSGTNGENWAGIALPLVRKVFGQIAAKEFVSVQPMNLPSGLVFFLDFQYGTAKNPFTNGGSLYGTRDASSATPFSTPNPVGGLYGAGRFTYSTNQFSASLSAAVTTGSWANVNYDSSLSASVAAGNIKRFSIDATTITSSLDPDAVRGFVILSGSAATVAKALPAFTTFDGTNLVFYVTASTAETNGTAVSAATTVFYNKKTADNARGDFEDTAAGTYSVPNSQSATSIGSAIPEINISMQSQAITAKTKKLKAAWTPEFAQDLNAYQNLDAEAELTNIMSEYISLEIDLEILDMLIEDAPAANTEYWSAVNNVTLDATTLPTASLGFFNTQGAWFQTLGTKIKRSVTVFTN
jgi:hypothetical protein